MTLVTLIPILVAQCELLSDPSLLIFRWIFRSDITPIEFPHMIVELSRQKHLEAVTALHAWGLVNHQLARFEKFKLCIWDVLGGLILGGEWHILLTVRKGVVV